MTDHDVLCIVEIPMGSRSKYEQDPRLGGIKLDGFLFSSMVYPTDYGYKEPEGLHVHVEGWLPTAEALQVLEESRRRHRATGA